MYLLGGFKLSLTFFRRKSGEEIFNQLRITKLHTPCVCTFLSLTYCIIALKIEGDLTFEVYQANKNKSA